MKIIRTLLLAAATASLLTSPAKAAITLGAEVLDSGAGGTASVKFTFSGDFTGATLTPIWLEDFLFLNLMGSPLQDAVPQFDTMVFSLNTVVAVDTNNMEPNGFIEYAESRVDPDLDDGEDFNRFGFRFDRGLVSTDSFSGEIVVDFAVTSAISSADFFGLPVVWGIDDTQDLFIPGPTVGTVVPEPATGGLLAAGAVAGLLARRRRK